MEKGYNIGITGASGFVGTGLTRLLRTRGHNVFGLTRRSRYKNKADQILFDASENVIDESGFGKLNIIVNLAGAGIAEKRWTKIRKKEIYNSRIDTTRFLVDSIKGCNPGLKMLLSASATGYYGVNKGPFSFKERDLPATDFLAKLCEDWEATATEAEEQTKVYIIRFGIVLGKNGGAFKSFAAPVKMGIKPIIGGGDQKISWIVLDDLCALLTFIIEKEPPTGIYNAVASQVVSQKTLMNTIGAGIKGHEFSIPVPALLLKLVLGEMSTEILKSCAVDNQKIRDTGFKYQFPNLPAAVRHILQEGKA